MRANSDSNTSRGDGLLASVVRFARRASQELSEGLDADRALQATMAALIEVERSRYAVDPGAQWKPGEPLKLLFAGYAGSRNTGADVRVEEMIRQFRHLFSDEHLDLSLLTIDPSASGRYFRTVKQLQVPDFYPKFLADTIRTTHGVVACEGSMFKSKFANALSTMMVGSLALARARGQLAIGYGGEAGQMDRSLEQMVRRYVQDTFLIARNAQSQQVLSQLGISSQVGTDTAWTFDPAPPAVGEALLRSAGWNGSDPILCLCPINAFWWPVTPQVTKGVLHALGSKQAGHYRSLYFHADTEEIRRQQSAYISALAEATRRFRTRRRVFPIVVGMERLDRSACEALNRALGAGSRSEGVPLFVSDEHDMYELVSVLRHATLMASSRYHAIVTSMPPSSDSQNKGPGTGQVASCGITMDERIRNLMADRGTPELCLSVDDPELADRLEHTLEQLLEKREAIQAGIQHTVVENLFRMGTMGQYLVEHIRSELPDFPIDLSFGAGQDTWRHLPPLSPALQQLAASTGRHEPAVEKLSASRHGSPPQHKQTHQKKAKGKKAQHTKDGATSATDATLPRVQSIPSELS